MDFNSTSFYAMRQKVVLDSIYKSFPATHIIHWGNNVPLAQWCTHKGIQSYFVEMGFMRNPSIESLVIDSCGVNSLSTISKSDASDLEIVLKLLTPHESITKDSIEGFLMKPISTK